METNAQKLPAVPGRDGGVVRRCVVMVCSYYFLYIMLISDYGIVFAAMSEWREAAARQEWISIKLSVLMVSLLSIVGSYFVLAICRKISWGEFVGVCGCCWCMLLQLVMMNVSPID